MKGLNNFFSFLTAVILVFSIALSPIILRGEDKEQTVAGKEVAEDLDKIKKNIDETQKEIERQKAEKLKEIKEADMKYCAVLGKKIPEMKEYCSRNKCTERDRKVLDMSLKDYEKCPGNISLFLVHYAQQYTGAMWSKGGRNKDGRALDELGLLLVCVSDVAKKPVDLSVKKLNEFKNKYSSGDGSYARIKKKGDLQKSALSAGDVVFYLSSTVIEDMLETDVKGDEKWYIWGAGIYNGKGKIIHASTYDENYSVLEEDFESFILRNDIEMIYHFSIKL